MAALRHRALALSGALIAISGCAGEPPSFPEGGSGSSASDPATSTGAAATSAPLPSSTTSGETTAEGPSDASGPEPASESTTGPATSTAASSSSGEAESCPLVQLEVPATLAQLTGDWTLQMSMILGVMVAAPGQTGWATFAAELPCADTWHVWVHMYDRESFDSHYLQVDGFPAGTMDAIFEVDCTPLPLQPEYRWRQLDYREPTAKGCEYLFDPWTFEAGPGPIAVSFWPREDAPIATLVFTNDPLFVPDAD